jgi:hypothetical protein
MVTELDTDWAKTCPRASNSGLILATTDGASINLLASLRQLLEMARDWLSVCRAAPIGGLPGPADTNADTGFNKTRLILTYQLAL